MVTGVYSERTLFSHFWDPFPAPGMRYEYLAPNTRTYAKQELEHMYLVDTQGNTAEFYEISSPDHCVSLLQSYDDIPSTFHVTTIDKENMVILAKTESAYVISLYTRSVHQRDVRIERSLSNPFNLYITPMLRHFYCAIDRESNRMWVICPKTGKTAEISPNRVKQPMPTYAFLPALCRLQGYGDWSRLDRSKNSFSFAAISFEHDSAELHVTLHHM